MCGICGWIDEKSIDKNILKRMTLSLQHRGPDSQDYKIFGNIGLGHSRLSIIDLSTNANQPMANEDNSIWITYNGEFYNFQDFQNELILNGHEFRSKSDTEVLLHLYEEYGQDFIKKINGMFAFAIWDKNKESIILARDRIGIKPLYYYHKNGILIFSSELKSIMINPRVEKEIDMEALLEFFLLGYIPRDKSIYKNVFKLLPGHYLIYKNNDIKIEKYWSIYDNIGKINNISEAKKELYERLNQSVRKRLISDVEIGTLLSGGLDSSIVTLLAAKNSPEIINTFSISFEEKRYDESEHARKIAEHIKSNHHEFQVSIEEAEEIVDSLIDFYDEPYGDPSAIPTYYVSKMARSQVKVVLSGDGGDELFGGYNWYSWVLSQNKFNIINHKIRNIISKCADKIDYNFLGKHFITSLVLNELNTFFKRITFFSYDELSQLMNTQLNSDILLDFRNQYNNSGDDCLQKMSLTDLHYYLPDDILTKVDRASMAVSLETRVPFLDHELVEFAFSLPSTYKIKNNIKKHILKEIGEDILPANFDYNRKQGFQPPLKEWMAGKLGQKCIELARNTNVHFLNIDYINDLYQQHISGKKNNTGKLWLIFIFLKWYNNVFLKYSDNKTYNDNRYVTFYE